MPKQVDHLHAFAPPLYPLTCSSPQSRDHHGKNRDRTRDQLSVISQEHLFLAFQYGRPRFDAIFDTEPTDIRYIKKCFPSKPYSLLKRLQLSHWAQLTLWLWPFFPPVVQYVVDDLGGCQIWPSNITYRALVFGLVASPTRSKAPKQTNAMSWFQVFREIGITYLFLLFDQSIHRRDDIRQTPSRDIVQISVSGLA